MNRKEILKYDATIRKCVSYIHENCKEICKAVNNRFDESKDSIRQFIIEKLQTNIIPGEPHYEWYYDGCPYDYSGDLKEDGIIDLDQTVSGFLENEYTGTWSATYESHHGKAFDTYGDELSYDTLELAGDILRDTVKDILKQNVLPDFTEEEFFNIMDETFDEIYTDCIAFDFFNWEGAIEFAGLGNVKISSILAEKGN